MDGRAPCAVAAVGKVHGNDEVAHKMGGCQVSENTNDSVDAGLEISSGRWGRRHTGGRAGGHAGGVTREKSGRSDSVTM
jgi:hypothetical protein